MTRILIVDDHVENLLYLEALFTSVDCTVDSAHDGVEALEKARQILPDVVISDLLMPVMDGYALLHEWKADPVLKTVPFMVYTATYTEEADRQLALNMGADAFILKPTEPQGLIAKLREVLASSAREAPEPSRISGSDARGLITIYTERVIRKLEEKTLQLEAANRALQLEIVERKHAEMAQRQLADVQKAILNALPAHIALVDAQGVIVSVNEAWRRFAAANVLQGPEFCVGQNYLAVCDQAIGDCSTEAGAAAAGIRSVLRGEVKEFVLEYPCHSPSEPRWFRLMVTPLDEEQRAGAVVMHVNITARKLSENILRDSEHRLNFALTAGGIGDWSLDLRTNVAHRSLRHDQCFGYSEMLPAWGYDTFLAHVDPADREHVDASFQKAMKGEGEYEDEFRTTWSDGSVHWLWTKGHFYFDDAGKPYKVAGIVTDITVRKRSEKSVKAALQRLIEAQRIGQMGDWEWDIATQKITWSPQVFEIVGRDPQLGPPRDFEEQASFYDASSMEVMRENIERAIATGERQAYEIEVRRPSGESVPVQAMAVPRKDQNGRVTGFYGTIQNISERKRAQALLEASKQRLDLATRSARIGIWDWDVVADRTEWNSQMYALYGIREQDFTTAEDTWRRGLHPEDRARSVAELHDALSGTRDYHTEFRVVWPDGTIRHIEAHAVVLRAGDGSPIRMTGVNWDITDRTQAKARVVQQAALIDEARDAILVRDLDNNVVFWSKGAERLYGWIAADAMGRPVFELLRPDPEAFRKAFETVIREGVWTGELRKVTRARASITVESRWTLLRDARQQPTSVLEISTDITARKLLEEQVRQAQKMEAVGTLAGGIAHDFNNILSAIRGNAELALTDLDPDHPAQESLAEIAKAARRAKDLVQQILSFSRRQPHERRVIALSPIVEETFRLLRASIPASVELVSTVANDLPHIRADATQIQQVVMNLCTNAWQAMDERRGRIDLTIDTATLDGDRVNAPAGLPPGHYARLAVTDTGRGMDAATLKRIFDPFFTTKPVGEGTGLGLSVVHGIVLEHGGGIEVISKPGAGTTFLIYLPAADAPLESVPGKKEFAHRGEGQHVLYLDDEEPLVFLARRALQRLGYRVSGFSSPGEALAAFHEAPEQFDLVITDLNMPGSSGLEVSGEILGVRPEIPIILISGYVTEELAESARRIGIRYLMYKPSTMDEMSQTIHQFAMEARQPR